MDDCIFCKIINRQVKGYIIDETDQVISFLSLQNHPLVIPKKHIPDIYSLDKDTGSALMEEIGKIAKATKKGLGCDGIYITQANGKTAGQDVFHIHFHIYPRWENNEVDEKTIQKEVLADKIKSALET